MCDPLTIAGLVLTAGSTGLNYAASQRVASARDDAMTAENLRQRQLDREAQSVNNSTRKDYKRFEKDSKVRGQDLGDYFTEQQAELPKEAALPTSASNVTVAEEAKQRGSAREFTNETGKALGELRSFGDILGDKSIIQAQDASQVGQIGGFKNASSGILSYELEDANHEGDMLKFIGDLAGGVGSLATMRGLSTPGAAPKVSGFPTAPALAPAGGSLGDLLGFRPSSLAAARPLDRASVPGYAALF